MATCVTALASGLRILITQYHRQYKNTDPSRLLLKVIFGINRKFAYLESVKNVFLVTFPKLCLISRPYLSQNRATSLFPIHGYLN